MPASLGFIGFSGVGKTTLLTKLVSQLKHKGIRIAVIKHAHHQFDIDYPGKDSYELRQSGAQQVLVASQKRWALITETPQRQNDPQLDELLAQLDHDSLDLILIEGFKHAHFPKIELHRPSLGHPLLAPDDKDIIAIATDVSTLEHSQLPVLDINNIPQIMAFIQSEILESPPVNSA